MDPQTQAWYQEHAAEIFTRYESAGPGVDRWFTQAFPQPGRILDIGCGSGRDVRRLLALGHDALGIDPCSELLNTARKTHPELKGCLFTGHLPDGMDLIGPDLFDGILCSAVLMHVPEPELFDAAFALRSRLKPGGRLLVSVPTARDDTEAERDQSGRLMQLRNPWDLRLLFERLGFDLVDYREDKDGLNRPGIRWTTQIYTLRHPGAVRPIDRIESILNRDRKVATYKLALFRALCDLALTGYRGMHWESSQRLSLPIRDIADKWLEYYWPLLENSEFIPQINGETKKSSHPLAFRAALTALIRHYAEMGGLTRFILDQRSDRLDSIAAELYKNAISRLVTAVRQPVRHAGGSLEERVFENLSGKPARMALDASLWREFVLMGHWIREALILRWAELTAQISHHEIPPSKVIDLLLTSPLPEREVTDARKVFSENANRECVWSGCSLDRSFDVDHAIPFSLWRNNDLWNLFPVHPAVNRAKSDALPSLELLLSRKDPVIATWEDLRDHYPVRFNREASSLTGASIQTEINWQNILFQRFRESVAFTAIQRGIRHWSP